MGGQAARSVKVGTGAAHNQAKLAPEALTPTAAAAAWQAAEVAGGSSHLVLVKAHVHQVCQVGLVCRHSRLPWAPPIQPRQLGIAAAQSKQGREGEQV